MKFDLEKAAGMRTPFYLYDLDLLDRTLSALKAAAGDARVHYAVKANGNPRLLSVIARAGLGADCVSGGEVQAAVDAGFDPASICYAGVGKTDDEIRLAIRAGIGCFNVESREELALLAEIAEEEGRPATVALRANPNIDAHTHHYITTGLEENKFGIDLSQLDAAVDFAAASPWLVLRGLHFHIGSQITTMAPFDILCERIGIICRKYRSRGIEFKTVNVGGGLGIDYDSPDANPVAPFDDFFGTLRRGLSLEPGQELHCELGRSVVGQCGSLVTRVLFVKEGVGRKFLIIDGGMNDLLRPALYGARHNIVNLSAGADRPMATYDVVGPICESADVFGKDERLPEARRGDFIALQSAGAYGESMASCYNMRPPAPAVFI